jgi:F-type H+-transporting ATPase subunit delta
MATDTNTTIARPYAKAAFEFALEKGSLQAWSDLLFILSNVASDPAVQVLVQKPGVSIEKLTALFVNVAGDKIDQNGKNFVTMLANNRRLLALIEIKQTFDDFKAEQEKYLDVSVVSFSPMTDAQKMLLAQSLKKRLNRDITLDETLDESILGGAIIRAGDLVLDGSVKGKLDKLRNEIVA